MENQTGLEIVVYKQDDEKLKILYDLAKKIWENRPIRIVNSPGGNLQGGHERTGLETRVPDEWNKIVSENGTISRALPGDLVVCVNPVYDAYNYQKRRGFHYVQLETLDHLPELLTSFGNERGISLTWGINDPMSNSIHTTGKVSGASAENIVQALVALKILQ